MTYTARKRKAAQVKARAKRIKRYRNKVAAEYRRLRRPYLLNMSMMNAALQAKEPMVVKEEVADYRETMRSNIRRDIAVFARNTKF
jgi:hypothetical protein